MHPWILALWLGSAAATAPDGWLPVERVVAVVDDDVVLASELERRVAQARVALDKLADSGERERRQATLPRETLQTLVEERLVAQTAARLAITIDDGQIDAAITQIRDVYKLDDAGLARAVADGGWTMAEYRQDLHHQLLRFKLISLLFTASITISDDAVQAEYAAEKAKNPALGESAGELEHLRAVLFERAMSEATARWLAEAHRNAYVELRL